MTTAAGLPPPVPDGTRLARTGSVVPGGQAGERLGPEPRSFSFFSLDEDTAAGQFFDAVGSSNGARSSSRNHARRQPQVRGATDALSRLARIGHGPKAKHPE